MLKFISLFALLAVAFAAPGLISQHHSIIQPAVFSKSAIVDHSGSSAITHQSFTNLERKVPLVHTYAAAPVLKTISTPVVHAVSSAPIVKTIAAPVVHTYATAPYVKTLSGPVYESYAAAPIVKTVSSPVVYSHAVAPVVHSAPLVKTIVSSPVSYGKLYH